MLDLAGTHRRLAERLLPSRRVFDALGPERGSARRHKRRLALTPIRWLVPRPLESVESVTATVAVPSYKCCNDVALCCQMVEEDGHAGTVSFEHTSPQDYNRAKYSREMEPIQDDRDSHTSELGISDRSSSLQVEGHDTIYTKLYEHIVAVLRTRMSHIRCRLIRSTIASSPNWARGQKSVQIVLVVLASIVACPNLSHAEHWKEHECLADAAGDLDRPATDYPADLWLAAQELMDHHVTRPAPRLFVADWLPEHGVYAGQHLGGCFDKEKWALQIIPPVMERPMKELVLIHELSHAVLDDAGIPPQDHHCRFSALSLHSRASKWLYEHNYPVNLFMIGVEVMNEYAMCQAAQNG